MCGIAGWYRRSGRPVSAEVIAQQCDTIIHRGPDDHGYFVDGDFGFGMRRLSIIDVGGGRQPIISPDTRHAIVFNGEIYNHLDLRRELEAAGNAFKTQSDTETLLAAYLHWKDEAWLRLEGMYAAAIWDRAERSLTLARDPLGIKPLYVTEQRGGLAFASELRALRVLPDHDFDVDEQSVHDFFSYGHVQTPRSIFRQVRSLAPGHVLRMGPEGETRTWRFWQPTIRTRIDMTEREWIEETRLRLERTVAQHMLADVPVGVFLSGGVDSSAVAAAMGNKAHRPTKAFTVGFPGSALDESKSAARIARHLGFEHIVLDMQPARTGDLLPAVQAAFDEPNASSSTIPHWHLSKLAAQHVKVVLCGEGSDEIFAGYKRQQTALSAARWAPWLNAVEPVAKFIDRLPVHLSQRWNYFRNSARRFRESAQLASSVQRFFAGTQISSFATRSRLYEPSFGNRQEQPRPFARMEQAHFGSRVLHDIDPLHQFMLADLTVHLPSALLKRLDRTSMAHSVEARVPFLSHRFVDWTLTMPAEMKLRGRTGKYALRKATQDWMPRGALVSGKRGFQLPFAQWFRGDFSDFAREAWHESGAQQSGYLQTAVVDELFAEHRSGAANHARLLYAIAMFSCWWQQHKSQPIYD
jgi:asparagine synthase (glutamine-hydrolysing)